MIITFSDVRIFECSQFSTKAGNPMGKLTFATPDNELFELLFFGNDVQALGNIQPQSTIAKISFRLAPASRGGVTLRPAW